MRELGEQDRQTLVGDSTAPMLAGDFVRALDIAERGLVATRRLRGEDATALGLAEAHALSTIATLHELTAEPGRSVVTTRDRQGSSVMG